MGAERVDMTPGWWMTEPDIVPEAPVEDLPEWTPFTRSSDVLGIPQYVNSRYSVTVCRWRMRLFADRPQVVYRLGIQNFDQSARHDWRDFQRIKNELIGPEAEGLELYPAESRLLDPSNYYLLWVLPKGDRVPLGEVGFRDVRQPEDAMAPQRRLPAAPAAAPLFEEGRR